MDREATTKNSEILYQLAKDLVADRKANLRDPEEDPVSSLLLEQTAEGEPLLEDHIIGAVRQSLVVGMVAPHVLLGSICRHLSEDQELQEKLRQSPSLSLWLSRNLCASTLPTAALLAPPRWRFSYTTESFARRARHHDLCQRQPRPRALGIADPVHPQPTNLASHLGFGIGRHQCAGKPLARMGLQIALGVLLKSTTKFEVNGPLAFARMPEVGLTGCPRAMYSAA